MSTITTGTKQNNITELNKLSDELYESIFNVNLIENKDKSFYFYNTLEKVIFPDFINTPIVKLFLFFPNLYFFNVLLQLLTDEI